MDMNPMQEEFLMKCKNCGAINEDYLEYCEQCAAPLTPDDQSQDKHPAEETGYKSYVASTGETPPAWGFVKAPQWPKPDFDANTVSEEDIPDNYFRSFNPRPAGAQPREYVKPAPVSTVEDDSFSNNVRVHKAPESAPEYQKAASVGQAPVAPSHAYQPYYGGNADAPVRNSGAKTAPAKPQPTRKKEDDDYDDFDDGYARARTRTGGGKRNLLFIAAAAVLVLLIVAFGAILIGTRYGGSFAKFISCTFQGDPITRAPEVEAGTTETGDAAYVITIYAKNNYIVRFTAGEIVREVAVSKGSVSLRVPEKVWIPDEPLDSATLSVTPDIVVISPKGEETQVPFDDPISIAIPAITLTMTQPTVSDFTVDSTTVAVAGVVDDNTASIFVGENQVAVDEAGNFSTNYTLPGEGTYVLEVKAQKNGCISAVATYNITYGTATTPTSPEQGSVSFSVNDDVKRYGTSATITVAGTMEQGATIAVTGVELEGAITQDSNAGTFSFTVKTAEVGVYEAVITATKGDAAKSTTVYLEHQPDKDAYMGSVYRIDYARIRDYPHHEQGYKIVGTITEILQTTPFVIARIQTTEGDIVFCYFSNVSTIEMGDGKTYELYADPYGTDETTGLPYMHAWFILKRAN
jgi:hypothetical protein